MHEAYKETRKDGAVGVDGQTAEEFEQDLEGNLGNLLELAKSGKYKAPPVRRTYIPKPGSKDELTDNTGKQRPKSGWNGSIISISSTSCTRGLLNGVLRS